MTQKENGKYKNKPRGQSLIEFALMLPILLMLVIGALEFGRLFFTKIVITNAAREAAYHLSINPGDFTNGTLAAVTEASNSGIPEVTVSYNTKDLGDYTSIEVTVETKVQNLLVLRLASNVLSATRHNEFPLSSTVEMMIQ